MLMRLTDEEWTVIVTLSPVWLWLCLPHTAGRVKMRTGVAGRRWRWEEPAPSGALRR
jgi:hypothetical protein